VPRIDGGSYRMRGHDAKLEQPRAGLSGASKLDG
jgi:hypothetical protein